MECRWLFVPVCLSMLTACAQDTLPQDTEEAYKSTYSNDSWELARLSDRYERRLHEVERRLIRKMNARETPEMDQIRTLENNMKNLRTQLDASLATQRHQGELLTSFQELLTHQKHELHRLKNAEDRLTKTVENLSLLVEELIADKESTTVATTSLENQPSNVLATTPYPNPELPFTPIFPKDCEDVHHADENMFPGFYYIMVQPNGVRKPFNVCCKMTNSSGWTLIQRRMTGTENFYRTWDEYRDGFGDLEGEFWLGNQHIYQLTNQDEYMLRVEMTDWDDNNFWAEYDHFRLSDEKGLYRLHVHGYHGNAGDSLTSEWESHDNQPFSTHDHDNDNRYYDNCAEHYHGAWWFRSCFDSHLNGVYYEKGSHTNYFVRDGIQWNTIHTHSSLQSVAMMIKPNPGHHEKTPQEENGIH